MNKEEELTHLHTQAIYLRKLLEQVKSEIAELEKPDEYDELKAAHATGKRIARKHKYMSCQLWVICEVEPAWSYNYDYKIVEDDEMDNIVIHLQKLNQRVEVRFTKSGLTGEITAEVVKNVS